MGMDRTDVRREIVRPGSLRWIETAVVLRIRRYVESVRGMPVFPMGQTFATQLAKLCYF